MVEMHLLWVNKTFVYDAIYALGVVTTFDRFMAGYQPESDKAPIFEALCTATAAKASQYRQDADRLLKDAEGIAADQVSDIFTHTPSALSALFETVAQNQTFKYSRLFAIGLTRLLSEIDPALLEDQERFQTLLGSAATHLGLPEEKLKKDVELYLSNLEKMSQARLLMEEMVETERKRREQREQEKQAKAAAQDAPESSPES